MKQPLRDTAMWFAVHARYRCEKAVCRSLERQEITAYLPLVNTPRVHGARRRMVECPLIPGYVFVHISLSDYLRVLQTDHVLGLVRFGSEIVPIPENEIDILRKFCANTDLEIIISQNFFRTGETVQVVAGPLKGVIGKLLTIQGRKNLVVELRNVGHSLRVVQMKPQYIRPLRSVSA